MPKNKTQVIRKFFINDKIMLLMVMLNTITIFGGGFGKVPQLFSMIDMFFTLLFLCEAIVKIHTYGWKDYWKDNWNKFDFIITMLALPSLANMILEVSFASNILLSLRTLRVFKSFRLLKFIPKINDLLKGINLAMKASLVVTIAFTVLMLIIAILSTAAFGRLAPDLFGDPGHSLFTTFRLFTGDGWTDIPAEITGSDSGFYSRLIRAGFALLFFAGGILGLSLINSIFVDAMASDNNDEVLERLDKIEKKIDQIGKQDDLSK